MPEINSDYAESSGDLIVAYNIYFYAYPSTQQASAMLNNQASYLLAEIATILEVSNPLQLGYAL